MITALAFTLALSLAPQDDPAKTVPAWIEKLRSDRIDDRDQATQELKKLGKAAIPELEKVAADKEAEVAARARTLLRLIRLKELFGIDIQDLNDMPASQVVEWMEKKTDRKFIYSGDLGLRNLKVRIPEALLLDAADPYALGVDLLRLAQLAVAPSDSVPGTFEIFPGAIGGKKGLKVYQGVDELPRANEFCSLVLHPRHILARDAQAVLINSVTFPQNCISVQSSGTLILSDYASVLRKCAGIVNQMDVSRTYRISVALLEARTGKEASVPEAFRDLKLADATGHNQFSVLGTAFSKLERVVQSQPGAAEAQGKHALRFPGTPALLVEFDASIRAAGGPTIDRFSVRLDQERGARLFEAGFVFKDEQWTIVGAVSTGNEGSSLVILARAVRE